MIEQTRDIHDIIRNKVYDLSRVGRLPKAKGIDK